MKEIILTADYTVGIPLEIGKRQVVQWGGRELEITSQETDTQIQIQLNFPCKQLNLWISGHSTRSRGGMMKL